MSLPREQAWFAAKRYGYGWSLPLRWQGWLVLGVYFAIVLVAGLNYARPHPVIFIAGILVMSSILLAICAWKGETPRWRWGGDGEQGKAS